MSIDTYLFKIRENVHVLLILGISLIVRVIRIGIPILEGTLVRQIQTASIARFFYHNGIDILRSKIDYVYGNAGYLVLEFPLYNILVSSLYKMSGGVHEYIGRLLSILFFLGSSFFVFLIVKKVYDHKAAIIALAVYNFSPLGIIFSRTIMPDSEMLFFSTGAIFFMLLYLENDRKIAFWLSTLCTMLSLLVKVQSFCILLPLLFLVVLKQKKKVFLDVKNYVFGMIALVPTFLWYSYGAQIHKSLSPERIENYNMSNWFNPGLFLTVGFYKDIFTNFTGVLLTPVGFVLLLLGLLIKPKKKTELLLYAWLFGTVLFGIVFCSLLWEPYYYLMFLPVTTAFIARVFTLNWAEIYENSFLSTLGGKVVAVFIIVFIIARYAVFAYVVPEGYRFIPEAANMIKELSSGEDLIVVSGDSGVGAVLYYSGRKGWIMERPEGDEARKAKTIDANLEELKRKGAVYFITFGEDDFLCKYLDKKYELIEYEENRHSIYRL